MIERQLNILKKKEIVEEMTTILEEDREVNEVQPPTYYKKLVDKITVLQNENPNCNTSSVQWDNEEWKEKVE